MVQTGQSDLDIKKEKMVGVAGLEPAAFASRTQHSTKLSHTPIGLYYITIDVNCKYALLPLFIKVDAKACELTPICGFVKLIHTTSQAIKINLTKI
jgi:hypothetical protein